MTRITPLRLFPCLLVLLAACSEGTDTPAPSSSLSGQDLELHFVTLNMLHGQAEAIPCTQDSEAPLAAASDLVAGFEERGARGVFGCVGDTTTFAPTITRHLTSRLGARARANVILDAMKEAGVEIFVPGLSDFQAGGTEFIEAVAAREIPLVMSNVSVEGLDENILKHTLIEHQGFRIACLGVLPQGNKNGALVFKDSEKFSITDPELALSELIPAIREESTPNFVIVYSALDEKSNRRIANLEGVNYILGTSTPGFSATHVLYEGSTGLLAMRTAGREVGLSSFKIAGGDLRITDISSRDRVGRSNLRTGRTITEQIELYGTDDPIALAPLVNPGAPQDFMRLYREYEDEKAWLAEIEALQTSSFEHHAATLAPTTAAHPVNQVLAGQGEAIRAQLSAMKMPFEELVPVEMPPKAADCVSCHSEQVSFWEGTAHATSVDSLRELTREGDGSCLLCHTATYARPSGYRDVRLDPPLGGVSCFSCHGVTQIHVISEENRTNPLHFIGDAEGISAKCSECHTSRHSPDFDVETALPAMSCPPMRSDDPALIKSRLATITAIDTAYDQGYGTPFTNYLRGRAELGLGRVEEATTSFRLFAAQSTDQDVLVVLDSASLLEIRGETEAALTVLRSATQRMPNEPRLILQTGQLLLRGEQVEARDPERAVAILEMVLPEEMGVSSRNLPLRMLQVEAYFADGEDALGQNLLQVMLENFPSDEDVRELRKRYAR